MFFQDLQEPHKGQDDQRIRGQPGEVNRPGAQCAEHYQAFLSMVKASIAASLMVSMITASLSSRPQRRLPIGEGLVEIGCLEPIRDQD